MYVKYDFLAKRMNEFFLNLKAKKIIQGVRDTFNTKSVDGVTVFDEFNIWSDIDGIRGTSSNTRYTLTPEVAKKYTDFYNAIGMNTAVMDSEFRKAKAIIAHMKFSPVESSEAGYNPTSDGIHDYITGHIRPDEKGDYEWNTCVLSYTRTSPHQSALIGAYSDPTSIVDLEDTTILGWLDDYSAIDSTLPPPSTVTKVLATTNTASAPTKQQGIWHNCVTVSDPHPCLAFAVLDSAHEVFYVNTSVLSRSLETVTNWDSEYGQLPDSYRLSVQVTYKFKLKTVASAVLDEVAFALSAFQPFTGSWIDAQIMRMVRTEFPLQDILYAKEPLYYSQDEDTPIAYDYYLRVDMFEAAASDNPQGLAQTIMKSLDFRLEREKSSWIVRILTMVVVFVAIIVSAIFQQWWVIPLIMAAFVGIQMAVSKWGKDVDAITVAKGVSMYSMAVKFISIVNFVRAGITAASTEKLSEEAAQQLANDMTFEATTESTLSYLFNGSLGEVTFKLADYGYNYISDAITTAISDFVKKPLEEIIIKAMSIVQQAADMYVDSVYPPVDNVEPLEEVVSNVEVFELVQMNFDSYEFCELNTTMEVMPYKMTVGLNDDLLNKYIRLT
jgi:hypothetical protein